MNLNETLENVIQRLRNHREQYLNNETAVRTQIINPILRSLDWDPEDPESGVIQEETTGEGRPDYTLMKNGKKKLFIEAKRLGEDIGKHDIIKRLRDYCSGEGVKYGLLTNGSVWSLYKTFEEGVRFEERIIWRADLENEILQGVVNKLRTFSRSDIDHLEELVKKLEILDNVWESIKKEPDDLILALADFMKGKIKIKDPYKHYDDCEIEDFLKEKIPELIGKKIKRQQIDPSTFGRSFESDIDRKRKVPNYIITYRKQLNQHDTMISRMRRCISEHKKITFSDLKQYLNEEYGYQTENNGSIAASLHTLKIEKIVTVQGQGEGKIIRISE